MGRLLQICQGSLNLTDCEILYYYLQEDVAYIGIEIIYMRGRNLYLATASVEGCILSKDHWKIEPVSSNDLVAELSNGTIGYSQYEKPVGVRGVIECLRYLGYKFTDSYVVSVEDIGEVFRYTVSGKKTEVILAQGIMNNATLAYNSAVNFLRCITSRWDEVFSDGSHNWMFSDNCSEEVGGVAVTTLVEVEGQRRQNEKV